MVVLEGGAVSYERGTPVEGGRVDNFSKGVGGGSKRETARQTE